MDRGVQSPENGESRDVTGLHGRSDERAEAVPCGPIGPDADHPQRPIGVREPCTDQELGQSCDGVRGIMRESDPVPDGKPSQPAAEESLWMAAAPYSLEGEGSGPAMRWGSIVLYAVAYVSSVAGAGFVSGREIDTFFVKPGPSLVAMGGASAAFAALGLVVTDLLYRTRAGSHRILLKHTLGPVAPLGDALLIAFVFLTFAAVEAGAGAFLHDVVGIPSLWGAAAAGGVSAAVILFGGRTVQGLQTGLVILVLGVLLAAAWAVPRPPGLPTLTTTNGTSVLWGFLYVGYNVMLATSALPPYVVRIGHLPSLRLGAVLGGVILGLAIFLAGDVVHRAGEAAHGHPLPLWLSSFAGPPWLPTAVGVALAAATAAALLSYLTALGARLPALRRPVPLALLWFASLPLASSGLVALVGVAYPIMAVLSLGFLTMFIVNWWDGREAP